MLESKLLPEKIHWRELKAHRGRARARSKGDKKSLQWRTGFARARVHRSVLAAFIITSRLAAAREQQQVRRTPNAREKGSTYKQTRERCTRWCTAD